MWKEIYVVSYIQDTTVALSHKQKIARPIPWTCFLINKIATTSGTKYKAYFISVFQVFDQQLVY
jgi:hypothetical protein